MGRPRKPTAILELTGAFKKDPQRAERRIGEPIPVGEIGDPPDCFDDELRAIWFDYVEKQCAPGVAKSSDRGAMEGLCRVTLRCRQPEARSSDFALLKAFLQQFGLSPASRSLVSVPQEENGNEFARAAAEIAASRSG